MSPLFLRSEATVLGTKQNRMTCHIQKTSASGIQSILFLLKLDVTMIT